MANTISISVVADVAKLRAGMDSAQRSLANLDDKTTKVGSVFKKVFGAAVIAGAGRAVGTFMTDAVQKASDLQETISKTGVVFGNSSKDILKWSQDSATRLGQTRNQALDAANTFAVFGKSAGLAGDDLTKFATQNTQLATDLASFNNTSPEEAIQALGAAFRGESEPLRRYGVLLDDASLRQEAMRQGLVKTTSQALTPQQKVLAAHALILKQTSDAQGDFARTSGGMANQQRILTAQWENFKTTIGTALLPVITQLFTMLNTHLIPAIKSVGEFFSENKGKIIAFGVAVGVLTGIVAAHSAVMAVAAAGGLVAWLRATTLVTTATKIWTAVQWALNAAFLANPITLVVVAIAALVAAFVVAYKKSETFRKIVDAAWNAIKAATVAVWNFLKNLTITVWNAIKNAISNPVDAIKSLVSLQWNAIKTVTSTVWNAIKSVVSTVINAVKAVVQTQINAIKTVMSAAWNAIKDTTRTAWNGIKEAVKSAIDGVVDLARGIKDRVLGAISGIASWLYNAGRDLIQGLINGIRAMADMVAGAAKSVVDGAINAARSALHLGSPSRLFEQYGRWTVQGLARGLANTTDLNKVQKAAGRMTTAIGSGFEAPSLSLSSDIAVAQAGGGNTYNITVNVPPGASEAQIGQTLVKYITAYERQIGRRA